MNNILWIKKTVENLINEYPLGTWFLFMLLLTVIIAVFTLILEAIK